jgi:site-specific DNA-adenine methylase
MSYYRGSFAPKSVIDKKGSVHNFHLRNFNNIKNNIIPIINKIQFKHCDYTFWDENLKNGGFIVYCDPPYYKKNQAYKTNDFDTEEFWKIIKRWKNYGNHIFVSELQCPIEHEELFSKCITCTTSNKNKKMIDKLFYIL